MVFARKKTRQIAVSEFECYTRGQQRNQAHKLCLCLDTQAALKVQIWNWGLCLLDMTVLCQVLAQFIMQRRCQDSVSAYKMI